MKTCDICGRPGNVKEDGVPVEDAPTNTVPRELFERMVEAVIELNCEKRWMKNEPRERYQEQWAEIDALLADAVALRDREGTP